LIAIFYILEFFNYDCIIYTHFIRVAASSTEIDDVTNYVTYFYIVSQKSAKFEAL